MCPGLNQRPTVYLLSSLIFIEKLCSPGLTCTVIQFYCVFDNDLLAIFVVSDAMLYKIGVKGVKESIGVDKIPDEISSFCLKKIEKTCLIIDPNFIL